MDRIQWVIGVGKLIRADSENGTPFVTDPGVEVWARAAGRPELTCDSHMSFPGT
jgi:hypothetical protein